MRWRLPSRHSRRSARLPRAPDGRPHARRRDQSGTAGRALPARLAAAVLISRAIWPELAATHRVVCPDLRGHGWSGWPDDSDFRQAQLTNDAVALLDVLGLEPDGPARARLGRLERAAAGEGEAQAGEVPARPEHAAAMTAARPGAARRLALRLQLPLTTPWSGAARAQRDVHRPRDPVGLGRPVALGRGRRALLRGGAAAPGRDADEPPDVPDVRDLGDLRAAEGVSRAAGSRCRPAADRRARPAGRGAGGRVRAPGADAAHEVVPGVGTSCRRSGPRSWSRGRAAARA